MAKIYTVEVDGKQYDIEGDREPTEQEAREAIGLYSSSPQDEGMTAQGKLAQGAVLAGGAAALGGAGYGIKKIGLPKKTLDAVKTVGGGVKNISNVTDSKKSAAFAESIRASLVQAHSDKVATFGKQIDELSIKNPKQTVSLQGVIDELNKTWDDLAPEAKTAIKKTPYLKDMVGKKPKLSSNITLGQSQEVINYMNTKVPKTIRYNNLDILDTLNNIRGSQLDAFPEMASVRAEYREFIKPYNQIKSQFKVGKLLNSIVNKFGDAENQVAVENVLPKKVIKQMGGYRAAKKLTEIPSNLPFVGKTFKTIGGMFGYAPMAMQAFNIWRLRNDPEAQYQAMIGGEELAPQGSEERKLQTGRLI